MQNTFSQACGDEYVIDEYTSVNVTWEWFHCKVSQKCIHASSRCDLHPHPECIYEKDGVLVSEDEEDCFEVYKLKRLIKESAAFECPSLDHNKKSPAILSTVYNATIYDYVYDVTVIPHGVIVMIKGTRCDGTIDCWNGEDEDMCGFNTFVTFGAGNLSHFHYFS